MPSRANRSRRVILKWLPVIGTVVAAAAAAFPASASESTSDLERQALARANVVRKGVNARYRRLPGRKLVVTEVTSMGVVDSLTLVTSLELPREVPTENGIYFAVCSTRAKCPYPTRSAAWPAASFRPRRQALELAVKTFIQTSAGLVVVALPTLSPTWVVFERDDLLAEVGAPLIDLLAGDPAFADATLRDGVDRLTRPRTYVPLQIDWVGPGRETFLAMRLFAP
jgi:hypothetical protein